MHTQRERERERERERNREAGRQTLTHTHHLIYSAKHIDIFSPTLTISFMQINTARTLVLSCTHKDKERERERERERGIH